MYAVFDLETTGLRTSWHDRVVEVAVIHLDGAGQVTHEWCSLVNPDRDLGPQLIHGISAAEARRAPEFKRMAGHVANLLRGRVLVAHNLHFDAAFLLAEYRRLGIELPISLAEGLCTMRLAGHFLPSAGRSLHDCCRAAGLPPHQAHSALHDARAAAKLLTRYLLDAGTPPPWTSVIDAAAAAPWPPLATEAVAPVPRRGLGHREEHFLARLVDRLPRLREPQGDAYLDRLDKALLDRHISASEADALVATADEVGLARVDVDHLHRAYLASLAAAALEDGVLTSAERNDLDQVGSLLGLQVTDVDHALKVARDVGAVRPQTKGWRLQPGDVVVFTGAMDPPRWSWEQDARAAGLNVGDNVTKKTRLLVAADPDSMSGKARKARDYGVPVVHPIAFQRMLADLGR
ncbi:exonuclease domain-containing protein [Micromonospora sp. NPDC049801]|uniref:exonuclease domain-containing protein n=1 Tax=unclassified Micromonospora TaxID=2617518 RepID=UPI0033C6CDBC